MSKENWHLGKTISIGNIITTVVVSIGVIIWAVRAETNIEINSRAISRLNSQMLTLDNKLAEKFQSLENKIMLGFDRIERKIDQKKDR